MQPNTFYRVSVKALIKDVEGRVLVLKENQDTWSLPGGGLDHGEDPSSGILRELNEELTVADATILGTRRILTFEITDKNLWLMWVVYDVEIDTTNLVPGEGVTDIQFIDPSSLRESPDIFERMVYKASQ